jgi:hypothetical protein
LDLDFLIPTIFKGDLHSMHLPSIFLCPKHMCFPPRPSPWVRSTCDGSRVPGPRCPLPLIRKVPTRGRFSRDLSPSVKALQGLGSGPPAPGSESVGPAGPGHCCDTKAPHPTRIGPSPLPLGHQLTLAPLGPGPAPHDGPSSGLHHCLSAQAGLGRLAGLKNSESLPRGPKAHYVQKNRPGDGYCQVG